MLTLGGCGLSLEYFGPQRHDAAVIDAGMFDAEVVDAGPSPEVDAQLDGGPQLRDGGVRVDRCSATTGGPEVCNGCDDDGDGWIDEGPSVPDAGLREIACSVCGPCPEGSACVVNGAAPPRPICAPLLVSGDAYTCATTSDGEVKCWGWDRFKALTLGVELADTPAPQPSPTTLTINGFPAANPAYLSAGDHHLCAWPVASLDSPSLACGGRNLHYEASPYSPRYSDVGVRGGIAASVWSIAAGSRHTCILPDDLADRGSRRVDCWGCELAFGVAPTDASCPGGTWTGTSDVGDPAFVTLAAGDDFTCAVDDRGALGCWGTNHHAVLGPVPGVSITFDSRVDLGFDASSTDRAIRAIAAGPHNVCVINEEDVLYCWGANDYEQIKAVSTSTHEAVARLLEPVPVAIESVVRSVAVGRDHLCYVHAPSTPDEVACRGRGDSGQLGEGPALFSNDVVVRVPLPFASGVCNRVTAIAAGARHSCARCDGASPGAHDDEVHCWGYDGHGELGRGLEAWRTSISTSAPRSTGPTLSPHRLPLDTSIAAGDSHLCFEGLVLDEKELFCAGSNTLGELGTDVGVPFNSSASAVLHSPAIPGAISTIVAAGSHRTLAKVRVDEGFAFRGWGDALFGVTTGTGGTTTRSHPVGVEFVGPPLRRFDLGERFGLGVSTGGELVCWGSTRRGECGRVDTLPYVQGNVLDEAGAALNLEGGLGGLFAVGARHACADLDGPGDDDGVHCWGDNRWLQSGATIGGDYAAPHLVVPRDEFPDPIVAIAAGDRHTCAGYWRPSGVRPTVQCWGAQDRGQVPSSAAPDAATLRAPTAPVVFPLPLAQQLTHLVAGDDFTCAVQFRIDPVELNPESTISCWGANDVGQLGGSPAFVHRDRSRPEVVQGVPENSVVRTIAAGGRFACAMFVISPADTEGRLFCWGEALFGQLADERTRDFTPVAVDLDVP